MLQDVMTGRWQTVRVFISSTFRDMHAERDHLVEVVFPSLREKLEPHRIYLVDIDLRWRATKEQGENDQVLDLCLQQINECRLFFLLESPVRNTSQKKFSPRLHSSKHSHASIHRRSEARHRRQKPQGSDVHNGYLK